MRELEPVDLDSADSVNTFSANDKVVIVGFFENADSADFQQFKTVAEEFREAFPFGAVVGKPNIAKEFGLESGHGVVLFKEFDEKKNILTSSEWAGSAENLKNFFKKYSVPLIDEIGPQNYKNYVEGGLPLAYLFVDLTVDDQRDTYVELIRPIATSTKGKMNWVYIDWAKYAKHSERLGLTGKTVPALAIEKLSDGTHFAFDESKTITAALAQEWIDQFLSGELQPTIKSEEPPTDNSGPVKVVVAKTYDQIVLDSTKDVLVEFYAPWCGHCKSLAPTFDEVGKELEDVSSVVVAKIDATNNDVSPKLGIRGFPTIKFFPANDKQNPIDYNGDRTKADFVNFIREHASIPISGGKDEL